MINAEWLPVISEGVKWVRDKMGPSKKELKLRISDLESQVSTLAYGNKELIDNMQIIITAILENLKEDNKLEINADNIILIQDNSGTICFSSITEKRNENHYSSILDNIDDEITRSRLLRPSDRRENRNDSWKISKRNRFTHYW